MSSYYGHFPITLAQDHAAPPAKPPGETSTAAPANPTGTGTVAPTGQPNGGQNGKGGGGESPFGNIGFLLLMVVVFVYFMVLLPQKREKRKREELTNAMKKGDRAHTIGGEIGTIVDIRDTEVVLKVDDQNNTRIRYLKSAIIAVFPADDKA